MTSLRRVPPHEQRPHSDRANSVIESHKWFCTNGSFADFIIVMAETNPEGRPHLHASMFVVERGTPGLNIVREIPTMHGPDPVFGEFGNHAEIRFENCRVPHENLIGKPGDGFVLAQKRLGGGRIHHAMRWIGLAKRALDILCERAVSRESHGKKLASHQMVQDFISYCAKTPPRQNRSEIESLIVRRRQRHAPILDR